MRDNVATDIPSGRIPALAAEVQDADLGRPRAGRPEPARVRHRGARQRCGLHPASRPRRDPRSSASGSSTRRGSPAQPYAVAIRLGRRRRGSRRVRPDVDRLRSIGIDACQPVRSWRCPGSPTIRGGSSARTRDGSTSIETSSPPVGRRIDHATGSTAPHPTRRSSAHRCGLPRHEEPVCPHDVPHVGEVADRRQVADPQHRLGLVLRRSAAAAPRTMRPRSCRVGRDRCG